MVLVILTVLGGGAVWASEVSPQYVAGDNPAFRLIDTAIPAEAVRSEAPQGLYWVRLPVMIERPFPAPQVLTITLTGAFEVYWDGTLLGGEGVPSVAPGDEVAGALTRSFDLRARDLTPGEHMIVLRVSNHRLTSPNDGRMVIAIEDQATSSRSRGYALVLAGAIGFTGSLIGLFFLWPCQGARAFGPRAPFAALAFLSVGIMLLAVWPTAFALPYHFLFERQVALAIMSLAFYGTLSFVNLRFLNLVSYPGVWAVLVGLPVLTLLPWPAGQMEHDARIFFALAIVTIALAVWRRAIGWQAGAIGVAAGLVGVAILFDPQNLFLLLFALTLVAAIEAAITFQRANTRALRKEAQVSRLELELLKRSIQPHFLMNTLAAVQELIETSSSRASLFVEALAQEFSALLNVTGRDLIPLDEEVQLCIRYLELMSLRLEANYTLEVSGPTDDVNIPPGILHTLIENCFSHGAPTSRAAVFKLRTKVAGSATTLELICPTSQTRAASALSSGTGLSYIKARLHEAFGSAWHLSDGNCQSGWRTVITIG